MSTLPTLLQKPITTSGIHAPLETLRRVALQYAYDDDAAQSAACIVARVQSSDLRGLLPGEVFEPPPAVGNNTGDIAVLLDSLVPDSLALEKAVLAAGVTQAEVTLLQRYTTHPLPHRRVVGYLALLCLAILRHEERYGDDA